MILPKINVLDEKDKSLRTESEDVIFPLSKEIKQKIEDMLVYLEMSQIEEYQEKFELRAGWGLSAIQIGVPKRIFVVAEEIKDEEKNVQEFKRYVIINPKIVSESEEKIYVGEGEGCLSVNRDIEGLVPRSARITITYQNIDGKEQTIRAREELAICFQHEIDHLNGILFVDRIDKKDPFKGKGILREI